MAAKPKLEQIKVTFLVMTRDVPARIKLGEHSLEYSDAPAGNLVSGVYGAHSKQMALVMASNWTKENHSRRTGPNQILQLDVAYDAETLIHTREDARVNSSGWIHFDRISADLRDDIKEDWLSWMKADLSAARYSRYEEASLGEIALDFPQYVGKMMAKRSPRLTAVVHPVRPSLDPSAVLWVATMRYDKARFDKPIVRFLPGVEVEI